LFRLNRTLYGAFPEKTESREFFPERNCESCLLRVFYFQV
jgi:hypothetical protein